MKTLINRKFIDMKSKIYQIKICFEKLDNTFIDKGMYNTKYKKLVKNLLFLDYEIKHLEIDFVKIEEAICHFLQKW